jgi:hypothetical protein
MPFDKQIGRLRVRVNENGMKMHDYGHGVEILCPTGWNSSCPMQTHTISVDELRDLHYVIGRAIEAASRERL